VVDRRCAEHEEVGIAPYGFVDSEHRASSQAITVAGRRASSLNLSRSSSGIGPCAVPKPDVGLRLGIRVWWEEPTFLREYDKLARQCAGEAEGRTGQLVVAGALPRQGNGPAANPEFHPAIAEYVQSRDLLCHPYRMRKRQQNDRDAKAQRASSFRQRSEQQQRRRSNRKVGVEVLLDGPHRLKSERLGVDRLLERIPVALDRRLRTVTRQLIWICHAGRLRKLQIVSRSSVGEREIARSITSKTKSPKDRELQAKNRRCLIGYDRAGHKCLFALVV